VILDRKRKAVVAEREEILELIQSKREPPQIIQLTPDKKRSGA
jgi:hypothetical protein